MEESLSSVQTLSRKRKKMRPSPSSNSDPIIGILTRSRSQLYIHRNRSGVSQPDPNHIKPVSFHPEIKPVEAFMDVNCINDSLVSSIKDLRMRRVFSRDLNSVLAEEEDEENEERKKMSKGSDVNDAEVVKIESSGLITSKIEDERNGVENGLNLKDREIYGYGSPSKTKMALNSYGQRKVFKNSSSFSFRRMLPYLMDIVNADSSVSKFEIVDAGIQRELPKLEAAKNSELRAIPENDTDASENEDAQKFHTKVPFTPPDLIGAQNEISQAVQITRPLEVGQIGHENDEERISASVAEECLQMTPPDPYIFTKREVNYGGDSMEANSVLAENQTFNGSLVGRDKNNSDVLRQSPSSKRGSNSINRPVLNPCSRLRLFKNPGSLSYRRLLPFLMDISNNNSCAPKIAQHPVPCEEQNYEEKIRTENSHEKHHSDDRTESLFSSINPMSTSDCSSPDTENSTVSSMPQSSSTNCSSNVEPNSVTSENLEQGSDSKENSSASQPSSTINNVILTKKSTLEEHELVGKPKKCLDIGLELHSNNRQSIEKVDLKPSSSQNEVSDALLSHTNGSLKGILKRNRRGCRGLCNCLNCASFRLHADRAFEFSRNQMHDAQEVASELMKELANLRLLLDKSTITDNGAAAVQLNPACNKARETEKQAKERLSQLNYELDLHCRIPTLVQPKVTFASYIQERAIPVLDPSTSTESKL